MPDELHYRKGEQKYDRLQTADPEAPLLSVSSVVDVADLDVLTRRLSLARQDRGYSRWPQHTIASVAFLFTKASDAQGTVDTAALREEPMLDIRKIFPPHSVDGIQGIEQLKGSCTEEVYQRVVRNHISYILHKNGFKVKTKQSIDQDETFAVVSVPPRGSAIKLMASRIRYQMPYTDEAYKKTTCLEPMRNREGTKVYAVGPYVNPGNEESRPLQAEFRELDLVRIMMTTLNMEMHLENLEAQGVITAVFPLSSQKLMDDLDNKWLKMLGVRAEESNLVKDYFGEEIGYFFRFLEILVKGLRFPALVGTLVTVVPLCFRMKLETWHKMKLCFCLCLVSWTAVFMSKAKRKMARTAQEWGMANYQEYSDFSRPEYKPELEGSARLRMQRVFVKFIETLYPVAFVAVISILQTLRRRAKEEEASGDMDMSFTWWHYVIVEQSSVLLSVVIQVFSAAWSMLAPHLATLENPRFNSRWEDILSGKLFFVTMFVSLWNFIYLAFVKRFIPVVCSHTLKEAAQSIWHNANVSEVTDTQLDWLQEMYAYENSYINKTCLPGCYPITPTDSARGGRITCVVELESDLTIFFVTQIVMVLVTLVLPVVYVQLAVSKDIKAAKKLAADKNVPYNNNYDDLQVQGKCKQVAGFGYGKGGGSKSEDFMAIIVNYGLLVTFGIVRPSLALLAMVAFFVMYKLFAYRMVHITARPEPKPSAGIGNWVEMFETLSKVGILTNTALAVFDLHPMRKWPLQWQLAAFLFIEHTLLILYNLVDQWVPNIAEDVALINDQIADFAGEYPPLVEMQVPEDEKETQADLGLRRE